ncbi:MAG: histidine phosphatase family protein [Chloroflexi bacterium]|nr:histidine phosphatase family protein [Chloroflexota bacterium]
MRLILVRHGETELNRQGRVQGQSREGLNPRGWLQAQAAARALEGVALDAVFTSPLPRALETARTIAQPHGLEVVVLDGLMEADVGEMDGLTGAEMRQRFPEFMANWGRDAGATPMPGGESLARVQSRAWEAVEGIRQAHQGDTVAAVSHNFTIHTLLSRALGMPLPSFRSFRMDLGAFAVLRLPREGPALLEAFNERCHLRSLPSDS